MDMWAIGCVVYELFTGKILFNGRTNNEMLRRMMDVKGPFPKKMLRKGAFTAKHFDNDPSMSFRCYEDDPVTRQPVRALTRPDPRVYSARNSGYNHWWSVSDAPCRVRSS